MENIWFMVFIAWVVVFIIMTKLWYLGKKIHNYAIVDVGWAFSLVAIAFVYYVLGEGFIARKAIIMFMVFFWGFRLSSYLAVRVLSHGEDARYTAFRKDYGDAVDRKFFTNIFQFQGLLDIILSIPFLIICSNPDINIHPLEYIGLTVFLFAVIGETAADFQLSQFKADTANKGKTCKVGLWNYSRHPNYFFEWMIWVSYFLVALPSPNGYFAIIPAILMLIFLLKFTGIPMTEANAIKTRGEEYREYQRTTSAFVPWFKKK